MTFTPVAALILAGAWLLMRFETGAEINTILTNEKLVVNVASSHLDDELVVPLRHLQSLITEVPVRAVIDAPPRADDTPMVHAFVSLAARNPFYEKVRWIDEHGMERVRINMENGKPVVVAAKQMQDKHERYFFVEAMRLKPGEIYISPLDLNMDNGQIEIPYKPMLRLASPVADPAGNPRGILIINIAARYMLEDFLSSAGSAADHLMLVNQRAYWLRSPDAADEWGFMLKRTDTFATRHPEAWAQIAGADTGQIELADGVWTWTTVRPNTQEHILPNAFAWKAIATVPAGRLFALRQRAWYGIGAIALLILGLYAFGIWQLLRVMETKRKAEFQAQLSQRDRRLAEIIQGMNEACFALDREWSFIFVNERSETLLRHRREEMLGNSLWAVFSKLVGTPMEQDYRRAMADRVPVSFEVFSPIAERWLDVRIFPSGDGIAVFLLDIELRKQAEAALRQSDARLETVIENMTEGLVLTDLEGRLLHSNRAAVEMHGFAQHEDWLARVSEFEKIFEVVTLEGAALSADDWPISRVCRGERLRHCELQLRKKGTNWQRIFSYSGERVSEPGGQQIGFITITDISARKLAEQEIHRLNAELEQRVAERTTELAASNKELEAFSYSVSHDLRAPLRGINGFARIVQEDYAERLDDEGRRLLDIISHEAKRMGMLIDDLLDFSRVGRLPLQTMSLDMTALAQSVFDELMVAAPPHSPRLQLTPLAVVKGDRALLRQVFFNLLANAVKFTAHAKNPLIEVSSLVENGHVTYTVQDNGVGFNEKYRDKLFGVFQRLHSDAEFEGTGVGLALVQRIVMRHGGRVWAEGEVNCGARFYFSLPAP